MYLKWLMWLFIATSVLLITSKYYGLRMIVPSLENIFLNSTFQELETQINTSLLVKGVEWTDRIIWMENATKSFMKPGESHITLYKTILNGTWIILHNMVWFCMVANIWCAVSTFSKYKWTLLSSLLTIWCSITFAMHLAQCLKYLIIYFTLLCNCKLQLMYT